MPKGCRARNGAGALALALFLLVGCAGGGQVNVAGTFPGGGGKLKDMSAAPSPDEDPKAPGQIPQECEALLNKSRDWGFVPEKWKPPTEAVALDVAAFFSSFHLGPENTSNFARAWLQQPSPKTAAEAQKSLARMDRAQSCDFLLAHKLLLSLLAYRWPAKDRAAVSHDFLLFVLNQQARVAPSMARAVQIDVLGKAVQKGFVRVSAREVRDLRKWFDAKNEAGLKRADGVTDPLQQWKLNREELEVSEEARNRLSRMLPLP